MICQIDNATGKVPSMLSWILKTASKLNYSICTYLLVAVSPRAICLRYANDFRMYSQLTLPIC